MEILTLLRSNWFELTQTAAIALGFVFTARSYSLESRSRRAEFAFQVTNAHRQIWNNIHSNPELARILERDRQPGEQDISPEEEAFVLSIILHLASVHQAILLGLYPFWSGLKDDVREFFSLPVPHYILEKNLPFQNESFQHFVIQVLG